MRVLHGVGRRPAPGLLRHPGRRASPVARSRRSTGSVDANAWAASFAAAGASQCGFCTPGIIMRAAAMDPAARQSRPAVHRALAAHLCRCTGWQPIVDTVSVLRFRPDRAGVEGQKRRGRRAAGPARGRIASARRSARCAWPRPVLRRHGAAGRARRRAGRRRRVARRRDAECGARGGRKDPRPALHRRPVVAARRAGRRLGSHAADDMGRAQLSRARRVVVRAGR